MSKPWGSLLSHDPVERQNVSVSKDTNSVLKTLEKGVRYRTRMVINSSYKLCDVEAMMAMKKDNACKWFHNAMRKHLLLNPVGTVLHKMAADKNKTPLNLPSVMVVYIQKLLLSQPVERLILSLSMQILTIMNL